jgi:hypothetical protein
MPNLLHNRERPPMLALMTSTSFSSSSETGVCGAYGVLSSRKVSSIDCISANFEDFMRTDKFERHSHHWSFFSLWTDAQKKKALVLFLSHVRSICVLHRFVNNESGAIIGGRRRFGG